MKMKKLNIYIIGLLTLMLCGIQSCALESEVSLDKLPERDK